MGAQIIIAESYEELIALHRADLKKWNAETHPEDRFDFDDWMAEQIHTTAYGWRVINAERDAIKYWAVEKIDQEEEEDYYRNSINLDYLNGK